MADAKLSALTEATTLGADDELYVNDSGNSKKIRADNLSDVVITLAGITASIAEINELDGLEPIVTTVDTQTLTNKTLTSPTINTPTINTPTVDDLTITGFIAEEVYALSGTTPAFDPGNGTIQTWTLSANSTPTDSLATGESMLLLVADGTAYTVTWPTMTWVGGSAPTLATSGYTVIELFKVGTTLYGAKIGDVA
jgi:hypothetical protein